MLNHTDHSPEMKVSYVEASHRMSCNIFTHMAWLITDDYPEVGDDGLSIPNNMNKLSTLPMMFAEWLRAFQHQSTSKAHRNCIAHPQRKQEPGDCSIRK